MGDQASQRILDRYSKMPLYQQLYEIVRWNITQGIWKIGDLTPTENELIAQYGVSRITVRQVLEMLTNEGFIYRRRGVGTFVAQPKMEQNLTKITNFTEDMLQRGLTPNTKVLFSGKIHASDDIAKALSVPPGTELARLERLRLADGEIMGVEESYLVLAFCPDILKHDFSKQSLRDILRTTYGIRIVRVLQEVQAVLATKILARQLSIPIPSAILFFEQISFSQNDKPVEFLRKYYRADRYSLRAEL